MDVVAPVSLPAGPGDLAVAASFAAGADDSAALVAPAAAAAAAAGRAASSASDSDSDSDASSDGAGPGAASRAEFEFSDEETRRAIPGVIRDGSESSEWSDSESSDDDAGDRRGRGGDSDSDVEALDLANMPKWLEDIKNGIEPDELDAVSVDPPRTKNELAPELAPRPPPPPPLRPDERVAPRATSSPSSETCASCDPPREPNRSTREASCVWPRGESWASSRRCSARSRGLCTR